MLAFLLPLLGPVVGKLLAALADKGINHWKTSAAGGGAAAATYVLARSFMESVGCPVDNLDMNAGMLALPSALVGLIGEQKKAGKLIDVDRIKTLSGATVDTIVTAAQTDKDGNPIPR